jgi:hypothetical protein
MFMLAIILSACLVSDPTTCKDYKIPLDESVDPTRCAMQAAPHFAKWADEHPGWVIKKWQCRPTTVNDI